MLLKADILSRALNSVGDYPIIIPDPKGAEFNFNDAKLFAQNDSIVFICPSYEGVDQRIFDMATIQPFRIADAIVPTGDSPAVFMAEAIARYLPDMLGCSDCVENDSILSGLLEALNIHRHESVMGIRFRMFYYQEIMVQLMTGR